VTQRSSPRLITRLKRSVSDLRATKING